MMHTLLICALAPSAIFPIISELLFTWDLVLWTLNMMSILCCAHKIRLIDCHVHDTCVYTIGFVKARGRSNPRVIRSWALGQPCCKPNQPTNSLSHAWCTNTKKMSVFIYFITIIWSLLYFVLLCIFCYTDIIVFKAIRRGKATNPRRGLKR